MRAEDGRLPEEPAITALMLATILLGEKKGMPQAELTKELWP